MTEEDKILDKIKKLLALANSSNEHEASLASEKANELLLKHNLSLSQLKEEVVYKEGVLSTGLRLSSETLWIVTILRHYFFVVPIKRFVRGARKSSIILIGSPINIEISQYVHDFLVGAYKKCWAVYKKELHASNRLKQSYYRGLTIGIMNSLDRVKDKVSSETGLMIIPDPKLESIEEKYRAAPERNIDTSNHLARQHGMQDGENIQIRKGIESSSSSSSILSLEKK